MTPHELAREVVADHLDGRIPFLTFAEHDEAYGMTEGQLDEAQDIADDLLLELRNRLASVA